MSNFKVDGVLIAGPTASGKSSLALRLAAETDGVIINADSMQVYDGLRVVTARPSDEDLAACEHQLYGVLAPSENCSAGRWSEMAVKALEDCRARGRLPIFVGGTGLYFSALTEGLSPIPDISPEIREQVEGLWSQDDGGTVRERLGLVDPVLVNRVRETDSQRLKRGLEVYLGTGRCLSEWQAEPKVRPTDANFGKIVLSCDRTWLYERCNRRFDLMLEEGAMDEVKDLLSLELPANLPIMKALGVPQLAEIAQGRCDFESGVEVAKRDTRRFAKRQMTWFRNQMIAWNEINAQQTESEIGNFLSIICN